jgi:molybdate transport system substrate-binding protein
MKRAALLIFLVASLMTSCSPAGKASPASAQDPAAQTLTIFAAASLTDAFTEIAQDFEASHPGIKMALNFAGSQTLSAQLIQGAVADVFASANHLEMDKVIASGLISKNALRDFLTNRLIVILPVENPAAIQSLQDLARPGLKIVLADATVPAGKYARQALQAMTNDPVYGLDFENKVMTNVVSNEIDVKQVVAKVELGEADAGIVYISDSIAAPDLKTIPIPEKVNIIATYPVAPLIHAHQPGLAAQFITYLLSPDGQAVLEKWGFSRITS